MSNKPFTLVVEDDRELSNIITTLLEEADIEAQPFYTAESVLNFLNNNFANLILLDVTLPDKSGFELLEILKQNNNDIPVIFLSGSVTHEDKIKGLNLGGDDYISKPFNSDELIARIHSVLKRTETALDQKITVNSGLTTESFDFCGVKVEPRKMIISFPNGVMHEIGPKELGLLTLFTDNPKQILSRRYVIHSVWGEHANVKSRSLDQYIAKVRNIYSKNGVSCEDLKTIHGVGFVYEPKNKVCCIATG